MDPYNFLIQEKLRRDFITPVEHERQVRLAVRQTRQDKAVSQPGQARPGLRQRLGLLLIVWGERLS